MTEVVLHGHEVIVEHGSGAGFGAKDADYAEVDATIAPDAETVFARAEMVVKVKERKVPDVFETGEIGISRWRPRAITRIEAREHGLDRIVAPMKVEVSP